MGLFDFQPDKNFITDAIEEDVRWKKSPTVQGVTEGIKAGLMTAPIGASVQALRGKNMVAGAVGIGIATGLVIGGLAAAVQKLKNLREEANLRYHTQNMIEREPRVFFPPQAPPPPDRMLMMQGDPRMSGFTGGFQSAYRQI